MNITDYILSQTKRIAPVTEVTPGGETFSMFNSGGVEVEIAEFLYALVCTIKPSYILETGTHLGISSTYMGLALAQNKKGLLDTFEVIPPLLNKSKALWNDLKLSNYVRGHLIPSLKAKPAQKIDLLFLDSEPQFRFQEFEKFWPDVQVGGFIAIHDLNEALGHHGQTHHDQYDWPYGYWRDTLLKDVVEKAEVQTIHLPNPRGMTLFQKTNPAWEIRRLLDE